MKIWQLEKPGKDNLHLIEKPQPEPGPGEILVRTHAVSLNYRDKAILDGSYPVLPDFPMTPASDLAGEVVSVGTRVTSFKAGDRVLSVFKPLWIDGVPTTETYNATLGSPLPGVLAEYAVLPENGALHYPKYLNPAQASTLPIAGVTAWVALFDHGHLRPEQTVLVQGSGGVSLFALQLAVTHGSRVIATSRSEGKIEGLKKLGAAEVINTKENPTWEQKVRNLTGGNGVDHVTEVLGGESLQRSISASAWGGHIAVIGFLDQPDAKISLPSMFGTAVRLQGVGVGSRKDTKDLLRFLEQHQIEPVIDATYDFGAVPDAFDHMDRGPFGKVVVEVR